MKSFFIRYKVTSIFILIFGVLFVVSINLNSGKGYSDGIIEADGKGYYAYLPAIFIYHDLNFSFFDEIENEKYKSEYHFYEYRIGAKGKVINKYYVGSAVAMAPFFLAGHFLSIITKQPLDGYSWYYTFMINIASLFWLFIACVYLLKILRLYNVKDKNITLILLAIVFGTNVFYYTVEEFAMSHIYSFAFINMFIFYLKKYFISLNPKLLPVLGFTLGMIFIIRPVNIIVLAALPFIAGSGKVLFAGLRNKLTSLPYLLVSGSLFILIVFIQLIIYKLQTGVFWVYSYGEEGFNLLNPHIFAILFSYKKGLFLYTPMLFISLTGLYFLYKKSKFESASLLIFLFFITYIFSSWWMWYYGGSFSSRVYIEYFAFFALMLGLTLENLKTLWVRRTYIGLMILFTLLCQIQTYQYRYYFIHWSDMDMEKYWDVFMRIDLLVH